MVRYSRRGEEGDTSHQLSPPVTSKNFQLHLANWPEKFEPPPLLLWTPLAFSSNSHADARIKRHPWWAAATLRHKTFLDTPSRTMNSFTVVSFPKKSLKKNCAHDFHLYVILCFFFCESSLFPSRHSFLKLQFNIVQFSLLTTTTTVSCQFRKDYSVFCASSRRGLIFLTLIFTAQQRSSCVNSVDHFHLSLQKCS